MHWNDILNEDLNFISSILHELIELPFNRRIMIFGPVCQGYYQVGNLSIMVDFLGFNSSEINQEYLEQLLDIKQKYLEHINMFVIFDDMAGCCGLKWTYTTDVKKNMGFYNSIKQEFMSLNDWFELNETTSGCVATSMGSLFSGKKYPKERYWPYEKPKKQKKAKY